MARLEWLIPIMKDVSMSTIVLWNRLDGLYPNLIIGCTLSIISNANITVFTQPFDKVQDANEWDFGPQTANGDNSIATCY